jgi:hypothetical protein
MATYMDGRIRATDAEPIGLLTEGAAGIAVIALTVIALAGISTGALASIATIVIGIGLIVQAFNSAAEEARLSMPNTAGSRQGAGAVLGGEVMVDCMCGLTGIVLGILALVGVLVGANAAHLLPPALIVFGGSLLLSGAIGLRPKSVQAGAPGSETQVVAEAGSPAAGGMEILIGLAAIVLGILSLITAGSFTLLLVGLLAVGAALLVASASFAGAAVRLFAA